MQRQKFVCGNWKMHGTLEETRSLIQSLLSQWRPEFDKVEVAICPPFTALTEAIRLLQGHSIQVGAQNAHFEERGAFTGEVSLSMLAELGLSYVILGHSERRSIFSEVDEFINRKVERSIAKGLLPILCIGETLEERERGATEAILTSQIEQGLAGITLRQFGRITIAYEPVWAIGTGKTATIDQIEHAHSFIRDRIRILFGLESAEQLRILYGGSVKPENAFEIFSLEDVDGGLIGGAALKSESFLGIVDAALRATT